jgi:hypothetical protein
MPSKAGRIIGIIEIITVVGAWDMSGYVAIVLGSSFFALGMEFAR